jgi:hypothetical protein
VPRRVAVLSRPRPASSSDRRFGRRRSARASPADGRRGRTDLGGKPARRRARRPATAGVATHPTSRDAARPGSRLPLCWDGAGAPDRRPADRRTGRRCASPPASPAPIANPPPHARDHGSDTAPTARSAISPARSTRPSTASRSSPDRTAATTMHPCLGSGPERPGALIRWCADVGCPVRAGDGRGVRRRMATSKRPA